MTSPRLPAGGANPHKLPGGLSPDSIDVPSELYTVLSRVRYTDKSGTATASGDGEPGKPGGVNTPAAGPSGATPAAGGADGAAGGGNPASKPLSTKDLVAATDPLKHKIQRARAAVHTLPDIQRSIPEQEAEIREWENKIARQKEVLQQLREFGIQFSHGSSDIEMGGTDNLAVSVAGNEYEDGALLREIAGHRFSGSSPLSSPLKNKASIVGFEVDLAMHVEDTPMPDVEAQSITTGPLRDAISVGFALDTQEAIVGTESPLGELAQEKSALEQQAEDKQPIEDTTLESANIVKNIDAFGTAPVGIGVPEARGETTKSEAINEQNSVTQEQQEGSLSGYHIEELGPSMPGGNPLSESGQAYYSLQGLGNTSDVDLLAEREVTKAVSFTEVGDEARRVGVSVNKEPPQLEVVDAPASNIVASNAPMELDTAALQAPELESMVQDCDFGGHGDIQPTHAETAEVGRDNTQSMNYGNITADLSPQVPSLAAADDWLRIEIPEHFKRVRNQLYFMKSLEEMQPASHATPSRSLPTRKPPTTKLNFTPKGKDKDSEPGGPSSSSTTAVFRDTPRKSRPRDSESSDQITEEKLISPLDTEEEVVVLTDPLEADDVEMELPVDDVDAVAGEQSSIPPYGTDPSGDTAAFATRDDVTDQVIVADPTAGLTVAVEVGDVALALVEEVAEIRVDVERRHDTGIW
ncbi:hypothetical protein VM1G_07699 [Cytospora mali]|uniref:Uncharacterized protein n=1 Tax=Cytospora mali TaxID=578113 RepID=A0A194W716_CYTMA|nr:hypothetical protein VM1G_07699 [Valsa mali]